jgi:hypothetical protein
MADFEAQLATIYTPDDDAAMRRLYMAADSAVDEVKERIAERCRELGIPERFAPSIHLSWHGRGENAIRVRREEVGRIGKGRVQQRFILCGIREFSTMFVAVTTRVIRSAEQP